MVVLAVLVGLGIWHVQLARARAKKDHCKAMLRSLGLSLHNYHDSHGAFPPAAFLDANGTPLHSWRIRASQSANYDIDFNTRMDFSKPWDDSGNRPFLDSLGAECIFQCPSGDRSNPWTTHYVAVTGPETTWARDPPRIPRSDKGRAAIMIVEWPRSDIHWAEPRDITVDQFMAWFTSEDARREAHHADGVLGLDVSGEVREISLDANPEEVRQMFMVGDEPGE